MDNPQIQLINILKINEGIKRNIFSLSFCDKKIEKEYLASDLKISQSIKIIMHFSYCLNFISKLAQGNYDDILICLIIKCLFASLCFISTISYFTCKSIKRKKFFDQTCAFVNYFYQVIFMIQVIIFVDRFDESYRIKCLNTLTFLSVLEILFSYESSIFFPILILITNVGINVIIFIRYDELSKNALLIVLAGLPVISFSFYKRYINELNRINFLQQYIFKKYSLYYYDLVNNMNGYHFTIDDNVLLKSNENFKSEILKAENDEIQSIKEVSNKANKKSENDKEISVIDKECENNYDLTKLNLQEKKVSTKKDLTSKLNAKDQNFNNLYYNSNKNQSFYNTEVFKLNLNNENEITLEFLRSLIVKKIDNQELLKFTENGNPTLYDLYKCIQNFDIFNKQTLDLTEFKQSKTKESDMKQKNSKKMKNDIPINKIFNVEDTDYKLNKFKYLGEFESVVNGRIYEVYFRKLKEYDNIIDFSIYNITKIKEAERVKAENEIKNKFFAKIAHEFKTPINSILGLITKIKSKLELMANDNENVKTDINQVDMLSNYIIYLIHDIIDYSNNNKKIEGFNIKNEKLDLKEIISFCRGIMETLLITKGKENKIRIEIDYDELIEKNEVVVFSDNFRIKQILLNFISNSVKFTKSGFIKLKTKIKYFNENLNDNNVKKESILDCENIINENYTNSTNNLNQIELAINGKNNEGKHTNLLSISNNMKKTPYLFISVIDTGMGIEKTDLKNIFHEDKKFKEKDYNIEGSGLGLSIVKYLTDSLNHQIIVESILGKGSEFALKIKCDLDKTDKNSKNLLDLNLEGNIQQNVLESEIDIKDKNNINKTKIEKDLLNKSESLLSVLNESNFQTNNFKKNYSIHSGLSNTTRKLDDLNFNLNAEDNYSMLLSKINDFTKENIEKNKSYGEVSDIEEILDENNSLDIIRKIRRNKKSRNKNKKRDNGIINKFEKLNTNIIFDTNKNSFKIELEKVKQKQQEDFRSYSHYVHNTNLFISNQFILNDLNFDLVNLSKKNFNANDSTKESSNYICKQCISNQKTSNDKILKGQITEAVESINLYDSKLNNKVYNIGDLKNPENAVKKPKILIVDDHKFIRESLVILIKKCLNSLKKVDKYEIIEGCDGVDILNYLVNDQANENLIKCVITDENMEYINGSEAISIIRKLEKNKRIKSIPIASISAFEDDYNKTKIRESGVNYILSKPCSESMIKKFFIEYNVFE